MTFKYRCSRCRCRNTFRRRLEHYARPKRCRDCGYDRFYWDREHNGRRPICGCDGYHFTHRKGSRMCQHNPHHELHVRMRAGESRADVLLEMSLEGRCKHTDQECPF